jgi:hypothetical protein
MKPTIMKQPYLSAAKTTINRETRNAIATTFSRIRLALTVSTPCCRFNGSPTKWL